jgi:hypothetical protein
MKTIRLAAEGGYIALMAILIVGAVALSVGLALLTTGTDSQRSALVSQRSTQARSLANACAEEALQQIYALASFTGTNNLTLGQGSCTYTVTNTGGNNRLIDTVGTVDDVVRKVKVYVTITSSSLSITSWQEVADA